MAGRPSIVTGYISVVLRAIENTQDDPVQLRGLVYDLARLSLGKHLLANYQELGSAGLQQHLKALETAINHVEGQAQNQLESSPNKSITGPSGEGIAPSVDAAQVSNERKNEIDDANQVTVRDAFADAIFEDVSSDQSTNAVVVRPATTEIYREVKPEFLEPIKAWEPIFGHGSRRVRRDFLWGVQLLCAGLIGVAIYAAILLRPNWGPHSSSIAEQVQAAAAPAANASPGQSGTKPFSAQSNSATLANALGFPLPSVYGVYAVNDGKLYELDALSMKVPDPRVAISALISDPSHVTVPDGKLQFVIFRRDLVSAAPTEAFVRVVARLDQEMKFDGNAPPTITKIEGQWAIRSKSYEFRVAPVGDNPEMVLLRPADQQLSLSPGRYALVLAGRGYDFNIAGQVKDTDQCLERTDVLGGAVYSQCRTMR
jgi:hypothetical protein